MPRKREDDDEEEDYLSDLEDVQDEDEPRAAKPKRKKRKTTFLDIEAEEDEAEDEDDEDDVAGLIDDNEDPEADEDRKREKVQRLQRQELLANDDPEEYARYIEKRFGDNYDDEDYDTAPMNSADIDQQSLLPTIRDPRLFIARIKKHGYERKAILTLLQKHFNEKRQGRDLGIVSAVAPEHMKGFIYVEATNSTSVENAINGLDLFSSYGGVKALKLEEMTDAVKTGKRKEKPKFGDWVRVNAKGVYKGDLAQIVRVIEGNENYVEIRLIPRIDIKGEREAMDRNDSYDYDDETTEGMSNLVLAGKRRGRPPQKLYDKEEIYRITGSADVYMERSVETGEIFTLWNKSFYRHGLIYLKQPVKSLIQGTEVAPQVDEVEKWIAAELKLKNSAEEDGVILTPAELRLGLNIKFNANVGAASTAGLFKGDTVHVTKGEQKGLTGAIVGFEGNSVLIKSSDFPEPLPVNRDDVVKTFEAGETVKVATGKYAGESGRIVHVEGEFLTLFTDSTRKEIRVLSSHVSDSSDLNPTAAQNNAQTGGVNYALFDLVQLVDDNSKAVVVKVHNDGVSVISTSNQVATVPFSGIKAKMKDRSARAADARGNPVAPNDSIHVISGPMKHRNGVVLHVSGHCIFFRAQDEIKNCGVIACLASSVTAATAAARRLKSNMGGRNAPSTIPQGSIASLGSGGLTDPRKGGGMGGMRGPRDPLLRQEVKVTKGVWKGYKGQVTYADAKVVRIQLAANMKTVKVEKAKIKLLNPDAASLSTTNSQMNGSAMNNGMGMGGSLRGPGGGMGIREPNMNNSFSRPNNTSMIGSRTPRDNNYMQTPNPGSISRRYGSTTPAPDRFGSMTPRQPYGSATPGPNQTPRNPYGYMNTPSGGDAFRPTTPRHNVDPYANPYDNPYGRSNNNSNNGPMTPANDTINYNPYSNAGSTRQGGVPSTPSNNNAGTVSTPGPYGGPGMGGGIMEPRTPANNLVPSTPAAFGGGIVEPRTPANGLEPQTPAPGLEPATPAPGLEPATPAPGLEPATPAPGLEPATPAPGLEPQTPHTPGIPQTPMAEPMSAAHNEGNGNNSNNRGGTEELGYKVLIDVVVSIASQDSNSGVVRDAAADGSYVDVYMLGGGRAGQTIRLQGADITPVQPRAEIEAGEEKEWVKVLDGEHQGKKGKLESTRNLNVDPEGVVHFNDGNVGILLLSLVAKCHSV